MSVLNAVLIGLAMGVVFGLALEKSRVFEGMILGQMQLRNFTMLKIFLAAVATGRVVLAALHGLGMTKLHPKATFFAADLIGGLAGAGAFIYLEPALKPLILSEGPGALTLDKLAGVPFWAAALAFAALWIVLLVALEKWRPWRDDLGKNADGDFAER